jgi:PAS domain S-box-containing protein
LFKKSGGVPVPESSSVKSAKPSFLNGGGEMGMLIRSKDWSATSLGAPEQWPQSLRTSLSILLNSKFPMFLFWGPELTCFYNDAYRPSLGNDGKHPWILGMPGEQAWPEIWSIIKPLIDQVLAGGEATWHENALIPIYRNGKIEDVYWTFSYSPVMDESQQVTAVFVTCTETTSAINNLKKLEESERNFRNLINDAPVPAALYRGRDMVIEVANTEVLKLWGKDKSILGKTLIEVLPELESQPFIRLMQEVYDTGKPYESTETPAWIEKDGKIEIVYFNLIYTPIRDAEGNIDGILAMGYDVSSQMEVRKQISQLEERTRLAVDAAMLGTFDRDLITGKSKFSKRFFEIWGFEVAHASLDDIVKRIHPDDLPLREQAHKEAETTGHLHYEVRIVWPNGSLRWVNIDGRYFFDDNKKPVRYIGIVTDITDQKNTLDKIEASEKKFRNTVHQAPVGITILRGNNFLVEMANASYLQVVGRAEKDFVGKPLFVALPEVKESVEPLLRNVIATGDSYYGYEFEVPLNRYGNAEIAYFNFTYQALREADGSISGIIVIANEVTSQVIAKHALQQSEQQFSQIVQQSPIAMTVWRGRDYIIEMANTELLKNIWRKEEHEVIGKKALEIFPELYEQKYPELLARVYNTGIPHREYESLAYVEGNDGMKGFYLDFEYSPLFDTNGSVAGIMITVYDVTEKVETRKKILEAEERLRIAVEASELGTFESNFQTHEISYSPRYADILGFAAGHKISHDEIITKIHPDDKAKREKANQQALQTGILDYELRLVPQPGKVTWIRAKGKVFYDEKGQPLKIAGGILDITHEKLSRQLIEESEERFRSLANSVPQNVWTTDAQGMVNYFNQSMYDYTGMTAEQLKDDGWIRIIHPDDRDDNIREWMTATRTGMPYLFEHRFRRHDGEYRWHLSRGLPQYDSNGKITLWVGTSTDIDDIKKHEQQKDDFIKMASHELKTPVTSIKGYVQLLQKLQDEDRHVNPVYKTYLSTIDRQVSKLTKLITDLLDITRIETGILQLSKNEFSINDLVHSIAADMQLTTPMHKIEVKEKVKKMVVADQDRISQVLINYITNAIKYSPDSDRIILEVDASGNEAIVSVTDFGIGIHLPDQEKVFERFFRAPGINAQNYPGFGIGLFIVQEIIARHHGKTWVESEKDKGSTFYFSLPLESSQ